MNVLAYQRTRIFSESPRSAEYRLLGQVTGTMIEARERALAGMALIDLVHWNREIWATFGAACADAGNALPPPVRAGIVSLALWVDRHSSAVIAGHAGIEDLIEVNRLIMEGLSAE